MKASVLSIIPSSEPAGWAVRLVGPDGRERSTWDGAWYNCGRRTFPWFATTPAQALEAAKAWILFVYGEAGPWTRNLRGDYVPVRGTRTRSRK